jgi:2-polyprenyl-6-methoxyphenol hydroxylase-like FAD-dependent oxidoreductase
MNEQPPKNGQKALVIGASIAGLAAAQVLADCYEQVILVERDILPIESESRKGVAQGQHLHVLLASGYNALEVLFPDIAQDVVAQGAHVCDPGDEGYLFFSEGGYAVPTHTGLQFLVASRPCLEVTIRRRLQTRSNVRIMENCAVQDLAFNENRSRVTGVHLRSRESVSHETLLNADLIVDATGRGSRLPDWLETMGYGRPQEEHVRIDVCYTSRKYRGEEHLFAGKLGILIQSEVSNKRLGCAELLEDGSWLVTLCGFLGEQAPLDDQGFLQFAAQLPSRDLYDAIKDLEPLTPPVSYKMPFHQRRRYEDLGSFPEGLLVLGDAVCSFNPTYGQGMTVAALEANALRACLEQQEAGVPLAQQFFGSITGIIETAWSMAVGSDLRFPEVQGPRTEQTPFLNWYMERLQRATHRDPVVVRALTNVMHMMAPASSLMSPEMIWHVFAQTAEQEASPVNAPL